MIWAKIEVLRTEIELLEQRLIDFDDDSIEKEKKLTEEQKERVEMHLETMKPSLAELEANQVLVKEALTETNYFAKYVEESNSQYTHKTEKPKKEEPKPVEPTKEVSEDEVHVEL